MARTTHRLPFKIYSDDGQHVGSAKYGEDAAMFVAAYGDGARVKVNNRIVWREGAEDFSAGTSYDAAAVIMEKRTP